MDVVKKHKKDEDGDGESEEWSDGVTFGQLQTLNGILLEILPKGICRLFKRCLSSF